MCIYTYTHLYIYTYIKKTMDIKVHTQPCISFYPMVWSTVHPREASICGIAFIRGPHILKKCSGFPFTLYMIFSRVQYETSSFHHCLTTSGESDFQCTNRHYFVAVIANIINFVSYTVNSCNLFRFPGMATRGSKLTVFWSILDNIWVKSSSLVMHLRQPDEFDLHICFNQWGVLEIRCRPMNWISLCFVQVKTACEFLNIISHSLCSVVGIQILFPFVLVVRVIVIHTLINLLIERWYRPSWWVRVIYCFSQRRISNSRIKRIKVQYFFKIQGFKNTEIKPEKTELYHVLRALTYQGCLCHK